MKAKIKNKTKKGMVVFAVVLFLLIILGGFFIVDFQTSKSQLIKGSVIKQTSSIITDTDQDKALTPTGYKNISSLNVGDKVVGYENGRPVINSVEKIEFVKPEAYNYPFTYYLVNETWELFKDQSVWANSRLVHAFELQVGDTIYNGDYKEVKITSIRESDNYAQWIRFTVSGNHSYVADGLLLHNASRYWVGGGSSQNWNATGNTN